MGETAVIFPGQGSQAVGMGRDVAEASPRARALLDRAREVLGFDLGGWCFDGPAERLERTDVQQPAIFLVSAMIWEAFLERGGEAARFSCTGGLSLGEYTGLYAAEALTFDDTLRLVRRRGELMQEAAEANPGGMVSLMGADRAAADALCERARGNAVLAPANLNCPGQVVISGDAVACDRAAALAEEFSCRAIRLPVSGAFHSPLMEPAAAGLARALEEVEIREPRMRVIANVSGEYHGGPDSIRANLCRQLTRPVLWQRCVERMVGDGVDCVVEMGPGRVLTGLMRKIDRKVTAINVSKADAIDAAMPTAGKA